MAGNVKDLERYVQSRVPGAALIQTRLPQAPAITLWLLAEDYPQQNLSRDAAVALMDSPPYWSFCWASGQVLAAEILENPNWVQGRAVIDFGSGSGVVAIAAALAGAAEVVAIDEDPLALQAARINANQNDVTLHLAESLQSAVTIIEQSLGASSHESTICVADVFYDRDNLPLLNGFKDQFEQILIADSRLGGRDLPAVTLIKQVESFTVPDLNESSDFNQVSVYRGADLTSTS